MTFSYPAQNQTINLELKDNMLTFCDQTTRLDQARYAISYYAAAQWEQQVNTVHVLKEKITGKSSRASLNRETNIQKLENLIPRSTGTVPVYLDLVDLTKKRVLIPLNLSDSDCQRFLKVLLEGAPAAYLGMGNENETSRALGLNASSKVLLYVLIALAFFAAMLTYGVLSGR